MSNLFNYGVAIESWNYQKTIEVTHWLKSIFGDDGSKWYIDQDFDLTLYMNEDVYIMYLLKYN